MKRVIILLLSVCLVCSLLSGCIASNDAQKETEAPAPTEEMTELDPVESSPFPTPTLPLETIPKSTDDSDYQLPPGERPTLVPEIK